MKLNPLLLCDYYKTVHYEQYPKKLTKIVSYFTPRMSRIEDNKLIMFGLQGFIKEYLIDYFNENFFDRELSEVVHEYTRLLDNTLGGQNYTVQKIIDLHNLGYLPIEIQGLPEGTLVPIKVPMFCITNTHPKFAWLVNALETLISCSLWHGMISANVGYKYRKIVEKYYRLSVDKDIPTNKALGDFAMRGQESLESATKSSAGWLLSFLNTATVPAIHYLEKYYNCNCETEPVGYGSPSTEHSVMCSNYTIDGDEITMVKRLLTEIYPNSSFSMVSDSYDYWNLVENILPQCRIEIENHNGVFLIRGDSGDPVEVVTETVFKLYDIFGGTINSKGFKKLNPKVKAIYGDSITPQRAEKIYEILTNKGFSADNVALGVGSFSMQALEEIDSEDNYSLKPFTRDTFGIAIKATYGEVEDEYGEIKPIHIFKNPKTDTGNFKKSQKGCCLVYKDKYGNLQYKDELNWKDVEDTDNNGNEYITYFKDGIMKTDLTLFEIRELINQQLEEELNEIKSNTIRSNWS